MDIIIIKDDFWTLMDVITIDLTCTNMVQQTSTTIAHAVMIAIQEKTRSYVEQAPSDDFILVIIDHMGVFIFVLIHL
jgi:hypothetical protein